MPRPYPATRSVAHNIQNTYEVPPQGGNKVSDGL